MRSHQLLYLHTEQEELAALCKIHVFVLLACVLLFRFVCTSQQFAAHNTEQQSIVNLSETVLWIKALNSHKSEDRTCCFHRQKKMSHDKPQCGKCHGTESSMWRNSNDGVFCNDCYIHIEKNNSSSNCSSSSGTSSSNTNNVVKVEEISNKLQENSGPKIVLRKSARNTRNYKTRLNPYALPKPVAPKGKGRRVIFKKTCNKAPAAVATAVTSDYVFYKGSYLQVGDIVSMRDVEGGLYYAQIRGLLTDQYCEKSCAVTWLLPTQASPDPEEGFDPATYIIGPEEEILRKLDCMEFVMHAPSDYFKAKNTPYPPVDADGCSDSAFIWMRLTPQIKSSA